MSLGGGGGLGQGCRFYLILSFCRNRIDKKKLGIRILAHTKFLKNKIL